MQPSFTLRSTKNSEQKRDPAMHQVKKGNQWCVSRTKAEAFDAVPKMGDGLPEPACRSWLQTARCCCVRKGVVVNDRGKGIGKDVR